MTEQEKKKTVNVEDMQSFGKVIHNKGIGSEGICTTAGATAAKEVTVGTTFSPVAGATLLVTFQNAITVAGATIAVTYGPSGSTSTLAAKPIYYHGAALGANLVKAGTVLLLRYDGTNFNIVGDLDTDTSTVNDGIAGETVNRYSECSTAAATAAKTASITAGTFSLEKGARVTVAFANENTADNPTLNINSTGAKAIYIQGEQVTTGDSKNLLKGTCDFVYNGSAWDMVSGAGGGGDASASYTPTLNAAPTSSTTTYTQDGKTKKFEIGQFCRVANAQSNTGYDFYQLYDLITSGNVTTAVWKSTTLQPTYDASTHTVVFPTGSGVSVDGHTVVFN